MKKQKQESKYERVDLTQIVCDDAMMVRSAIDQEAVADYAAAMTDGATFPPMDVFLTETGEYLLVNGWHRLRAMESVGLLGADVAVNNGTREEAIAFAIRANQTHGLRRTNADKRRSIEVALAQWPDMSSRSMADLCGCSHEMVQQVRPVSTVDTSTRTGSDGKQYPARLARPEDNERDEDEKDEAESADADREDSDAERTRDAWADFEDALKSVSGMVSTMEGITVPVGRRFVAMGACRAIGERLESLAQRIGS